MRKFLLKMTLAAFVATAGGHGLLPSLHAYSDEPPVPKGQSAETKPNIAGSSSTTLPVGARTIRELLLSIPVQKDLSLTKSQIAELDRISREQANATGPLGLQLRDARLPDERAKIEDRLRQSVELVDSKLVGVLNEKQNDRLDQIAYQTIGVRALLLPSVAYRLNISPSQDEAIREILANMDDATAALKARFNSAAVEQEQLQDARTLDEIRKLRASPGYAAARKRLEQSQFAVKSQAEREIRRLLTKGQKERLRAMAARPVEVRNESRPVTAR
ncbi:MAG: hypothetical protein U0835_08595 [Isosphaeraceae bacterium]